MTNLYKQSTKLARQIKRFKTYNEVARMHPHYDGNQIGDIFIGVCSCLQLLRRDHAEVLDSFEFSRLRLMLSGPDPIQQKLTQLGFDSDAYLYQLKTWLNEEPAAIMLNLEDMHLFLQTARVGRRNFQAARHDPERFCTNEALWAATIIQMALAKKVLASAA